MNNSRKNLTLPISVGLISVILICQVKAEPSKIFVRDVEFNSDWIKIGEEANIKMNIVNLSKKKQWCNVTFFWGGKKIKQEQVAVETQSSVPLHQSVNTSGMSAGTYSIETIIESLDQQKMFDLGEINLLEDSIMPNIPTVDSFDSPILLTLIPIGIAVSIAILIQKRRKKSDVPEDEFGPEVVPKLLGGVFNMQEKEESINSEVDNTESKKGYIC